MEKFYNEKIDWNVADTRLIKYACLYFLLQSAVDWTAELIFSSNVRASRLFHSYFGELEDFTPALKWLKATYYHQIDGIEFSQVFSIYVFLLALLGVYVVALCAGFCWLLLSEDVPWRKLFVGRYAGLLILVPFSFWGIHLFLVGPSVSAKIYGGLFGTSYIESICIKLPMAQFLILCIVAFYYSIAKYTRGIVSNNANGS